MQSLQNHFLIATPTMNEPLFKRSVTYICEHSDEGAMGLIVNQPANLNVTTLLDKLEIVYPASSESLKGPVFQGGPVGQERGFVIHPPQENWRSSLQLSDDIMVTTSRDILEALGSSAAPPKFILTLGYAGWEAGQLEQELAEDAWLAIPAAADILFNTPTSERWQKATEMLGFDVSQLAPGLGHA
ncbi:YqgE/AlgH family protein [Idiomarina seosinensis]|uniref:YqgE/AlgH family protein n=1 Tax=Idiomarina seosinensis TaxID=281739 RepID=UPI00384C2E56